MAFAVNAAKINMSKGWQLYMQSQSRRYIILGIVALLVVFVLIFTFKGRGVIGKSYESTCNQFIDHIITQDAQKSYALFSNSAQRNLTRDQWKEKMTSMQPYHYKAEYTLESTNELSAPQAESQGDSTPTVQLNYIVSSPPYEASDPPIQVNVSCTATETADGVKIDGYTMAPRKVKSGN